VDRGGEARTKKSEFILIRFFPDRSESRYVKVGERKAGRVLEFWLWPPLCIAFAWGKEVEAAEAGRRRRCRLQCAHTTRSARESQRPRIPFGGGGRDSRLGVPARMSGGGGSRGAAGPVPASARKLVQGLKEIVNRPDAEIYAALRECDMDPDEAVSRLLSQGLSSRAAPFFPPCVGCFVSFCLRFAAVGYASSRV
jgi:hypothetical protein